MVRLSFACCARKPHGLMNERPRRVRHIGNPMRTTHGSGPDQTLTRWHLEP